MNIWVARRCINSDTAATGVIRVPARPDMPLRLDPRRAARLYNACPKGFPKLAGWQSGYATDCKSVYSGSIPLPASTDAAPPWLSIGPGGP